MDPSRGDSRYNLNYSMSSIGLSLADQADVYGNPAAVATLGCRPSSGELLQTMGGNGGLAARGSGLMTSAGQCQTLANANNATSPQQQQQQQQQRGLKRAGSDCYDDHHRNSGSAGLAQSMQGLDNCNPSTGGSNQQQQNTNVPDVVDDSYSSLQNKKSPPANGKKTKGRVKIKMEYIDNKLRRYTTFSKRKTGIMKKAYELSTLTGTQVMLLVASETGHVYTFATRKLQPMITSEAGKQLIQTCLNSPDPPSVGGGDQRMSATGFEETELSYNIADEDSKGENSQTSSGNESEDSSDMETSGPLIFNGRSSTLLEPELSKKLAISIGKRLSENPNSLNITAERLESMKEPSIYNEVQHNRCNYQSNKKIRQEEVARTSSVRSTVNNAVESDNYLYQPTIANIPHDVLQQLIQSGQLPIHTEENGHQYVAIPLSSSAANLIKSRKLIKESAKEQMEVHTTENQAKKNIAGTTIKEELE